MNNNENKSRMLDEIDYEMMDNVMGQMRDMTSWESEATTKAIRSLFEKSDIVENRISINLNGKQFMSFGVKNVPTNDKELAAILREVVNMLEAENIENKNIF